MPSFQTVRGMRDLLPNEAETLNSVIVKARETAKLFGYEEVICPVVESYELLSAKSGEEIRSRMFTFKDLGDRTVALRPEFTASIARLATTAFKNEPKPLRIFSVGTVYRYDEPQRGRYREFWQSNFELMGSNKPEADAEVILLTNKLMNEAGLKDYAFKIGHVGVLKGILEQEGVEEKTQNAILQLMDKREYEEALKLVNCEKCKETLRRLLEAKGSNAFETAMNTKELVKDYAKSAVAVDNLIEILDFVTESGCKIEGVDPAFARGLEYYTGMIFEVYIPELEIALGGGGRYDRLIETFGGEPTPAVGVAHGLDRITLAKQTQNTGNANEAKKKVLVIPVTEKQKTEAMKIAQMLRKEDIPTEFEIMGRRITRALEYADRRKIDLAIIVGENELKEESVVIRDLAKREQKVTKISNMVEAIKN